MKSLPPFWERLSKSEDRALSRYEDHAIRWKDYPNSGAAPIVEPPHSETYELRPFGKYGEDAYQTQLRSMCEDYLRFFRSVIAADDFVFAHERNHSTYKFWPHYFSNDQVTSEWPVEPYPNGEYPVFVASNLKSCLFGYPGTRPGICVIGPRFVEALREWKPRAFGNRIRIGDKPYPP
jgi:Protein of unknown function (DUF2716)